jgi:hypothetical protein
MESRISDWYHYYLCSHLLINISVDSWLLSILWLGLWFFFIWGIIFYALSLLCFVIMWYHYYPTALAGTCKPVLIYYVSLHNIPGLIIMCMISTIYTTIISQYFSYSLILSLRGSYLVGFAVNHIACTLQD